MRFKKRKLQKIAIFARFSTVWHHQLKLVQNSCQFLSKIKDTSIQRHQCCIFKCFYVSKDTALQFLFYAIFRLEPFLVPKIGATKSYAQNTLNRGAANGDFIQCFSNHALFSGNFWHQGRLQLEKCIK